MNADEKIIIGNIQRFCLHDGDGIRTTVFLKGCNLRCPWCANPENLTYDIQEFKEDGIVKHFGKLMSEEELLIELLKDKEYYKNGGGVTYSGGEPLLTLYKIEEVLNILKSQGISQWVETSLYVTLEQLLFSLKYIDGFIIDIKNLYMDHCKRFLGGDTSLFLSNFKCLYNRFSGRIIFRIPLVIPYTLNEENINSIVSFANEYSDVPIQIFKVHNLGFDKYKKLGIDYISVDELSDDILYEVYDRLRKNKLKVEILHL